MRLLSRILQSIGARSFKKLERISHPIERQQEILNALAQIIHDEAPAGYDLARCEYQYMPDYCTISSAFSYSKDGVDHNPALPTGVASKNLDLTEELRLLVQEQTGGQWTSFVLTLDADGRAKASFEYPEP